jgi:hypothetical protein
LNGKLLIEDAVIGSMSASVAKIVSSSRGVNVDIIPSTPMTFEIPFH